MTSALLFVSGGALILSVLATILLKDQPQGKPEEADAYGSHGSGRWATADEVAANFASSGPGALLGRIRVRQGLQEVLHSFDSKTRNRFLVLFGPPGSGKTTRYTLPNLLHAAEHDRGRSILVTDPKGELYRNTAELMRKSGFTVRVYDLCNPQASDRYNPLAYVHSVEDALRLAQTIISNTESTQTDDFWVKGERTLLACLIWYTKTHLQTEHQHLGTVLHLGNAWARDKAGMDAVFGALDPEDGARRLYGPIAALSDKTRDGVFVGFAVRLQLWASSEITALTAANDIDLREIGRQPTVLYLIIPDHHTTYRALTSLFFDQAFQELISLAEASGGRLPVEVRVMLEEMANIGRIPDLAQRLATIRSRGLIVEMVLQTLGQLRTLYPDTWTTILGCSDTLLTLAANDQETAEYISQRLGVTTIRTTSVNSSQNDRGASAGQAQQYTGRALMLPDEVQGQGRMGLKADELLLMQRGLPPARISKYPIDEYPGAQGLQLSDPAQYAAAARTAVKLPDPATLLPGATVGKASGQPQWAKQ